MANTPLAPRPSNAAHMSQAQRPARRVPPLLASHLPRRRLRQLQRRPAAGSSVTDYGLYLWAQRLIEDTAEKPTHYAIGSGTNAEAAADVALQTQIGARSAFNTGYPLLIALSMKLAAFFDAATYGGNTVAEVGIFTASSGSNALVRAKLPSAIVLGITDSFAAQHRLSAGAET